MCTLLALNWCIRRDPEPVYSPPRSAQYRAARHRDADTIQDAFADYYRTTVLAEETDPDRLHDLKAALDGHQVYSPAQVEELVERYLSGSGRDRLDPTLDACVSLYREQLDEDGQLDFKGKAKAFLRTYGFLVAILRRPARTATRRGPLTRHDYDTRSKSDGLTLRARRSSHEPR